MVTLWTQDMYEYNSLNWFYIYCKYYYLLLNWQTLSKSNLDRENKTTEMGTYMLQLCRVS